GAGAAVGEVGVFGTVVIGRRVRSLPRQRQAVAGMDRDIAAVGQFEPYASVLDDLLCGDIAAGGRDADDVDVVLAAQVGERERIVDSGVTVEEERHGGGHGSIVPDVSSHRRRNLVPISSPNGTILRPFSILVLFPLV